MKKLDVFVRYALTIGAVVAVSALPTFAWGNWYSNNYIGNNCYSVPEPSTLLLLATGLCGLGGFVAIRRIRQK